MRIRLPIAVALLVCANPVFAREPTSPIPMGNPGDWAGPNDYPLSALREDKRGVVRFVLGVSVDGAVTDCSVRESSGDEALDAKTCELMRTRARFSPARDSRGRATAGTWASSVRWEIPDVVQPLPPEVNVSYRFVVEKDGTVSSCDVLAESGHFFDPASGDATEEVKGAGTKACESILGQDFIPMVGDEKAPIRSSTTMTFKTERTELPD